MTMNEQAGGASAKEINIMLVSHTNVGKTTLVRTILGKDVGEVLDAPDVTRSIIAYDLVVDQAHGALRLWDTPGFGDSFRLAKRLQRKSSWIAWIIREIWDRFVNPQLWRNQRVAQDLRDRASVVLYLVNSKERPVDAIYFAQELKVLEWVGKPVLAILNQNGYSEAISPVNENLSEWRNALAAYPVVRKTLSLDSYTRCWIQELILVDEIGHLLPEQKKHDYLGLAGLLQDGHQKRFDESINAISEYLVNLTQDQVELPTGWFDSIKDLWGQLRKKIPWGKSEEMQADELAMRDLAQRFMEKSKSITDKLIVINRLKGVSAGEIIELAEANFTLEKPIDQSSSVLTGGVISGALSGLGADLMAGGLTLGSGALVGAILGGIGSAALSKGYNVYSHKSKKNIGWSKDSLTTAFTKTILLYLSIAHFGRGQGDWRRKESPEHWQNVVDEVVNQYHDRLVQLWEHASHENDLQKPRNECEVVLKNTLVEVLRKLYPEGSCHIK